MFRALLHFYCKLSTQFAYILCCPFPYALMDFQHIAEPCTGWMWINSHLTKNYWVPIFLGRQAVCLNLQTQPSFVMHSPIYMKFLRYMRNSPYICTWCFSLGKKHDPVSMLEYSGQCTLSLHNLCTAAIMFVIKGSETLIWDSEDSSHSWRDLPCLIKTNYQPCTRISRANDA